MYFASTLGGQDAKAEWDEARPMAGEKEQDAYVHHVQVKNTHVYMYETGFVKVETHDSGENNKCTFVMDADGNITLYGTSTITLKAKNIVIDGSTQVDIKTPNLRQDISV